MDLTEPVWRKSSRSGGENACVEVGEVWCEPIREVGDNECVQIAAMEPGRISAPHKAGADHLFVLRDSKDPDGPRLYFTPAEWKAFRLGVKDGEFDAPARRPV